MSAACMAPPVARHRGAGACRLRRGGGAAHRLPGQSNRLALIYDPLSDQARSPHPCRRCGARTPHDAATVARAAAPALHMRTGFCVRVCTLLCTCALWPVRWSRLRLDVSASH